MEKRRIQMKHLGFPVGRFPTGHKNSITDVPGVRVGHSTINRGSGPRVPGKGPVRTGVTAIIPDDNIYMERVISGAYTLHGAGEVSGLIQIQEWGIIETPILLTNTLSVGRVSDACVKWMADKYPQMGNDYEVVIPVVGECDDSFLNDAVGRHIKARHVFDALNSASDATVAEGSVGAGTGMVCCDFKGGIGSSSRIVMMEDRPYNLGVLVLTNFGRLGDLRIHGIPVGKKLLNSFSALKKRSDNFGSIIVIVATDLPLNKTQLDWLCKRSALGIGRCGSYASYTSGEIIVGFATANKILREPESSIMRQEFLYSQFMDDPFEATIEATEEAIINSLINNHDMVGSDENFVPALPVDKLITMLRPAIG